MENLYRRIVMTGEITSVEFEPLVQEAKQAFKTDISYLHDMLKQSWQIRARKESKAKKQDSRTVGVRDRSGV